MTTEKKDILLKEGDVSGEQNETITIDLKQIYSFDPKDIFLDISDIHYSNLAYIQVTHRDVYIDFLEMPGIKREGKVSLTGTRIYMSHAAAQKLAESLGEILERVHTQGDMETYPDKEDRKTKSR
jgi:hypothetical protein